MVDAICEPFMKRISAENLLVTMFGVGKGSGQYADILPWNRRYGDMPDFRKDPQKIQVP